MLEYLAIIELMIMSMIIGWVVGDSGLFKKESDK